MVVAETQPDKHKIHRRTVRCGANYWCSVHKIAKKKNVSGLGMTGAQRLLRGAEKIGTKDKRFRTYIKTRNYDTALADA